MSAFFFDGVHPITGGPDEEVTLAAVSALTTLPSTFQGKLDRNNRAAVEKLETLRVFASILVEEKYKNKVVLSPTSFSQANKNRIPFQVVDTILEKSRFGKELISVCEAMDIPGQIYGSIQKKYVRSALERRFNSHLACIVMCSVDVNELAEFTSDVMYQYLEYHYNWDRLSFKRLDLFPTYLEQHKKILKVLALNFGRYFNDERLLALGRTRRTDLSGLGGKANAVPVKSLLENPPPHLSEWVKLWKHWRRLDRPRSKSPTAEFGYLSRYLANFEQSCGDPKEFLSAPRPQSFLTFYGQDRLSRGLREYSSSYDFPLLIRFSLFLEREIFGRAGGLALFPLISEEDVGIFQNKRSELGLTKRRSEAGAMPLPIHYYQIFRELLEEGESGWPGRHHLCQARLGGKIRYVPVLPILYLTMFDIPLRTVQIRRLCSGEGDDETFDGHQLKWVPNLSPFAGYWRRDNPTFPYRGYARRTNSPGITGFFINTNKHSDPFLVAWQNAELHGRLYELRCWQEQWNPLSGPVQLKYDGDPEEGANDRLPIVFPLFRMPPEKGGGGIEPLSYHQCNQFWKDAMREVQRRWNERCLPEDQDFFVKLNRNGQVTSSTYTSHGMRVAGITLLLQGGLPIELISKMFAGHATIIQSLYYVKFQAEYLSKKFDGLNLREEAKKRADLFASAKKMTLEEASTRLVSGSVDAFTLAMKHRGSWQRRDIGICPYSGMRCGNGNPEGGMVEGGSGNCLLCRHHLTAPEYAHGIWAYGEYLLYQITKMNKRINELTEEIDRIELRQDVIQEGDPEYRSLNDEKRRCETLRNDLALDQMPLAKAFAETQRLLRTFEEMTGNGVGQEAGSVLIASEHADLEFLRVPDVEKNFLLSQNSEIYRSTYSPEVEQSLLIFAQDAVARCGYETITMGGRTPAQIRAASKYAVQRILQEVDRQKLVELEEGTVTIDQLVAPELAAEIFSNGLKLEPVGSLRSHRKLALEGGNENPL